MYINVKPAYGTDYKSKKDVQAAWESNKDFIILDVMNAYCGSYINREDAEQAGNITAINVRYAKQAKIHVINLGKVKA